MNEKQKKQLEESQEFDKIAKEELARDCIHKVYCSKCEKDLAYCTQDMFMIGIICEDCHLVN